MTQTEAVNSIKEYASRETGFAPDEIAVLAIHYPVLSLDNDEIITAYQIVFPGTPDERSPVLAVSYEQRDPALGVDIRYYAPLGQIE